MHIIFLYSEQVRLYTVQRAGEAVHCTASRRLWMNKDRVGERRAGVVLVQAEEEAVQQAGEAVFRAGNVAQHERLYLELRMQ
jgi:hypothetical protein